MRIQRIPVGSLGTIDVSLPIVTIGNGKPVVSFVTGLHGGEESGLWLLRDLVAAARVGKTNGTLRILPSGNPLTQAFKQRYSPLDFVNPNRAFPGSDTADLSHRIGAATVRAIAGSDLVIDLHCFTQDCPFIGVLVTKGDPELIARERAYLRLLRPDFVWVEASATPDGMSTKKNLSGYLNSAGVPNIALEMPRADHLTRTMRNRVVSGLLRVLRSAGSVSPRTAQKTRLLELSRFDVTADTSAFFLPLAKPLVPLSRGQVVGHLVDPTTFRETAVCSPIRGRLFLIARPGLVRTGDKLFAIGRPVL